MPGEGWLDISVPIHDRMLVFPETPGVEIERVKDLDEGDGANVSALRLSTHTGTHIDAPRHFLAGGADVEAIDLDALNGPARVLDLAGCARVGAEELEPHGIASGERVLLRTANSSDRRWHERDFDPGYGHLAAAGARHLVDRGAAAVGIDYLSVGGEGRDSPETHRTLLEAGVAVLEGLALEAIDPGDYELRCLPLRIPGGDGAPARALLRPTRAA